MNNKMLTFTLIAGLMALATGQIISEGSCPENVQVVETFDASKYLGKWHEYARYPVSFETDGICVTAEYSVNAEGNVNVKNSMINSKTNIYKDILGTASLVSTGKFLVKFPISPVVTISSNYWVLATDYDNYSVVYSCTPMKDSKSATLVWILTRQQVPEPQFIEKAVAVLKKNNISLLPFQNTNQIACN